MEHDTLDDIVDEIENVRYQEQPVDAAEELESRGRDMPLGATGRAAYLAAAAESWSRSGDGAAAVRCAEAAVADGGPSMVGNHATLIDVLLAQADVDAARARATDLRRLLAAGLATDTIPEFVAESFEEADLLDEAHRWFNLAASQIDPAILPDGLNSDLSILIGRRRVRQKLGLAEDRLDQAGERARERTLGQLGMARPHAGDTGVNDDRAAGRVALLHWPGTEFDRFVSRWPDLADGYGGDLAGHRRSTEAELRELSHRGLPLAVATGDLDEYVALVRDHDLDPEAGASRARYAAELGRTGQSRSWPPGRNDECWCGSGQKYKRCCGHG